VLVIDAHEGVRENSRRMLLLGMQGINSDWAINKMDWLDTTKLFFERVKKEYDAFLQTVGITPAATSLLSGAKAKASSSTAQHPWYTGQDDALRR
jgi:sulfate adenylyltransferase subunit 1 (EFTu-like GTPase family)